MSGERYIVEAVGISVHNTPEEHYWAEDVRALIEDDGTWRPRDKGPIAEHMRALDREMLLGVPRG